MAGTFKPLDDFLDDSITLPITYRDGTVHDVTIPGPSAEDGLRIERVMETGLRMAASGAEPDEELLDDAQELDMYRAALGPRYDELRAELSWPRFKHVAITTVMWITQSLEVAEKYWATGGDPSLLAPNRQARRASSAAASKTQKRGSTSGTSTRKATGRASKGKASRT
jgi:hypothetical protein